MISHYKIDKQSIYLFHASHSRTKDTTEKEGSRPKLMVPNHFISWPFNRQPPPSFVIAFNRKTCRLLSHTGFTSVLHVSSIPTVRTFDLTTTVKKILTKTSYIYIFVLFILLCSFYSFALPPFPYVVLSPHYLCHLYTF